MPADRRSDTRLHRQGLAVICQGVVLVVLVAVLTGIPFTPLDGLVNQNSKRADEIARVVHRLADLVAQIQSERRHSIELACMEQNRHYFNTLDEYDARIASAVRLERVSRAQLRRLKESRRFTVALVRRLAPPRDCLKRVEQLAPSSGP